jgi:hypothetical protein
MGGAALDPFFEALMTAGRLTDRPDIEMQFGKMKGATRLETPVRFVGEQINRLLERIPQGSRPTARAVLNMIKSKTKNQNIKNIIDQVNSEIPQGQSLSDIALDRLLARVPQDFRPAVKAHIRASLPSFFVDQPDIDKPTSSPTTSPPSLSERQEKGSETRETSGRGQEFDDFVEKAKEHVRQKTGVPTDEQRQAARAAREASIRAEQLAKKAFEEREKQSTEEAEKAEREAAAAAEEAARLEQEAKVKETLKNKPPVISKDPTVKDPDPRAVHHRGQKNQTSHTYGVDFTAGSQPSQFTDIRYAGQDPRFFRRQASAVVSPQTALSRPAPKKKSFAEYLDEAEGGIRTTNFVGMVGDSSASYGSWINRYNIKYSTAAPFDATAPIIVPT